VRFGKYLVILGLSAATLSTAVQVSAKDALDSLAVPSVRSPIASDNFYFVMTDRYRDGDPSNNRGGKTGDISETGFEPASEGYFHGGDLAGLTGKCDVQDPQDDGLARIKRLGFTAVWITPPFVQRTVQGSSAAYHGYWFLDLSQPDPHLGTEADFAAFMSCAKSLGLKVFLDVVVNHTADVITFKQDYDYVSLKKAPYRTATGKIFNPWNYTNGTSFPRLSRLKSFAKTPRIETAFIGSKYPAILNDVTKYHNRGNISWGSCVGRCEMDGDFSGLDDIMTEDWSVIQAMAQAYGEWIKKYDIDGFRIDTAKHTDPYFFGRWLPLINNTAQAAGKSNFTSFGEVWLTDPAQLSEQMLTRKLPSVLDFPYQDTMRKFVSERATGGTVAALFGDDDFYTSATTNAYGLTTFLGNHDMGRIGFFIKKDSGATGQELIDRDILAHDLLYMTRGIPIEYYGDEVGMTGSGDGQDKRARQDMFPTQVPDWKVQERIGSAPIEDASSFAESNIIEARIRQLTALRSEHPALATGAQITRYGEGSVFAASRIDAQNRNEYVIAFNSSDAAQQVTFKTSTPSSQWLSLMGDGLNTSSDSGAALKVTIPALSSVVLKAVQPLPTPGAPSVSMKVKQNYITGRYELSARVPGSDPASVTFLMKGKVAWMPVGTDDAAPFKVFVAPRKYGDAEFAAVVTNSLGQTASVSLEKRSIKPFF